MVNLSIHGSLEAPHGVWLSNNAWVRCVKAFEKRQLELKAIVDVCSTYCGTCHGEVHIAELSCLVRDEASMCRVKTCSMRCGILIQEG